MAGMSIASELAPTHSVIVLEQEGVERCRAVRSSSQGTASA